MTSQFSPKVSQILAFSREEATRLASRSVGPEHLLLGILRGKSAIIMDLFSRMDINVQSVKEELEQRVREDEINQPINTSELVLNEKASNILKLAVLEARIQRTQLVDVQHLLLAILHDQVNNGAKEILELNNMNYEDTLLYLQKSATPIKDGLGLPDEDFDEEEQQEGRETRNENNARRTATATKKGDGKTPVLDNFSTDLTQAALEGKLDPVVGREREIQRVIEILCRRKKNNPILIGEPGVGKSAIVEGLAQMIAKHHTSPILFNKRLVNLDMTAIVAGTKYRGQFEERIRALLKELEQNPDIIVFIDEIHTMIGAGSTPGSMDAANIMKPALARGTIQCIGATTLDEFRNSIEKDGALERRFQKVIVEPTTAEQTLEILNNIKERYEQHHHVNYTDDALKACVRLTERYVTDRFFPDKAIDALDEVLVVDAHELRLVSVFEYRACRAVRLVTDDEVKRPECARLLCLLNGRDRLIGGENDGESGRRILLEFAPVSDELRGGCRCGEAEVGEGGVVRVFRYFRVGADGKWRKRLLGLFAPFAEGLSEKRDRGDKEQDTTVFGTN